ncbi:MAG: HD domain-containing protein [Chloroflexi bacterium]|nr:HD domain-containing protein [Chloroflexota bacterium]
MKYEMVKTARYRVGQFLRALTDRVADGEVEQATSALTPEARALFRRQAAQDQRHALAVYRALRQAGHTNPHLLAAALLHDAGKAAARLPAWQRAIVVLLERFAPRLLARLSQGESQFWNRPFVVHAQHPEAGARWAQEAGCSPLTAALIRRHQDQLASRQTEEDQLLAALQAADNLN